MDKVNKKILELRDKQYSFEEIQKVVNEMFNENLTVKAVESRYWRAKVTRKKNGDEPAESEDVIEQELKKTDTTIHKDGTQTDVRVIEIACEADKTPDRIMELHGYDPVQWEMVKSQQKTWNVYSKKDGVSNLYSSSIVVRPIQNILTTEFLKEMFEKFKAPVVEEYKYTKKGKYLLELPIMDLHLGKLAWKLESGEDYDLKIAEQLYKETILDILSRIKKYGIPIERIIFPIGQDFFNTDNEFNMTTKGTPQDVDGRWQKMFEKGVELLIWAIELLRKIAPVECPYIPANHDYKFSYFASQFVKAYYRSIKSVKVDTSPKKRKYIQYGLCMLGITHGDTEKGRIDTIMQGEAAEMWGATIFRELHMGHLHSEQTKEIIGLILRRISSITSADRWHSDSGYVCVVRKAQAFIWHKENGLQLIINSNVRK